MGASASKSAKSAAGGAAARKYPRSIPTATTTRAPPPTEPAASVAAVTARTGAGGEAPRSRAIPGFGAGVGERQEIGRHAVVEGSEYRGTPRSRTNDQAPPTATTTTTSTSSSSSDLDASARRNPTLAANLRAIGAVPSNTTGAEQFMPPFAAHQTPSQPPYPSQAPATRTRPSNAVDVHDTALSPQAAASSPQNAAATSGRIPSALAVLYARDRIAAEVEEENYRVARWTGSDDDDRGRRKYLDVVAIRRAVELRAAGMSWEQVERRVGAQKGRLSGVLGEKGVGKGGSIGAVGDGGGGGAG